MLISNIIVTLNVREGPPAEQLSNSKFEKSHFMRFSSTVKVVALYLEGFQAIEHFTEIEINNITLLFGPNSAGKSCITDALDLARSIFDFPGNSVYQVGDYDQNNYGIDASDMGRMYHPKIWKNWRKFDTKNHDSSFAPVMTIGIKLQYFGYPNDFENSSTATLIAKYRNMRLHHTHLEKYETCARDFELHMDDELVYRVEEFKNLTFNTNCRIVKQRAPEIAHEFSNALKSKPISNRLSLNDGLLTITERTDGETIRVDGLKRIDSSTLFSQYSGFLKEGDNGYEKECFERNLYHKEEFSNKEKHLLKLLIEICNDTLFRKIPNIGKTDIVDASRKIPSVDDLLVYLKPEYDSGIPVSPGSSLRDPFRPIDPNNYQHNFFKNITSSPYHELAYSFTRELINNNSQQNLNSDKQPRGNSLHEKINNSLLNELFKEKSYQLYAIFSVNILYDRYEKIVDRTKDMEDQDFSNLNNHGVFVRLLLRDSNDITLDFNDVGSGIGYILPVLQSIHSSQDVIVQQPELHLHPALQSAMGDVFIDAWKGHDKYATYIIETHSEHLLLRLLKRIRQTKAGTLLDKEKSLSNENISIYYFDPQINGATIVKKIRISQTGELMDKWPKGFFEERYLDLFDE